MVSVCGKQVFLMKNEDYCGYEDKCLEIVVGDYAGSVKLVGAYYPPITISSLAQNFYLGFQYQSWFPSCWVDLKSK